VNVVHLHLAINHSPLYTELFAFALLVIGLLARKRTLVTAGLVVAIIGALCAFAATWSGDGAADIIKHSPPIAGVDKTLIDPHEEAAGYFETAAYITGGLALISLIIGWRRGERFRWLDTLIALAVLFSLSIAVRTALLGGRIHHPEVRAVVGQIRAPNALRSGARSSAEMSATTT
jgi:MFS family permease